MFAVYHKQNSFPLGRPIWAFISFYFKSSISKRACSDWSLFPRTAAPRPSRTSTACTHGWEPRRWGSSRFRWIEFSIFIQCDQIGQFFEFLGNWLYYKSSPNVWWLFGQLWKALLFNSNWLHYFLGNFWKKIGLLFISTSGHTGCHEQILEQHINATMKQIILIGYCKSHD